MLEKPHKNEESTYKYASIAGTERLISATGPNPRIKKSSGIRSLLQYKTCFIKLALRGIEPRFEE